MISDEDRARKWCKITNNKFIEIANHVLTGKSIVGEDCSGTKFAHNFNDAMHTLEKQ